MKNLDSDFLIASVAYGKAGAGVSTYILG